MSEVQVLEETTYLIERFIPIKPGREPQWVITGTQKSYSQAVALAAQTHLQNKENWPKIRITSQVKTITVKHNVEWTIE